MDNESKPGLMGGLVRGMMERCESVLGLPVCYMQLDKISVAIVTNAKYKVSCALFYDSEDGEIFGKLIATEVVESFCAMFQNELERPKDQQLANGADTREQFHTFHPVIGQAIRNSINPVLEHLASSKRAIETAFLVNRDTVTPENARAKIDPIAFIAQYQSLLEQSRQIMLLSGEIDQELVVNGNEKVIYLKRIEGSVLVVVINKAHKVPRKEIDKHTKVLKSVLVVIANLMRLGDDIWNFSLFS